MRKWIIVSAVLFVFCAIVVLALLNLNSLINRNKDYFLDSGGASVETQGIGGRCRADFMGGCRTDAQELHHVRRPVFLIESFC